MRRSIKRGVLSFGFDPIQLDARLVWLHTDRLDVDAEQDVAHGGIPDGYEVVDLATADLQGAYHLADLIVDAGDEHGLEFAWEVAGVVADAVHHVRAAEPLRILKRCHIDSVARLKVDEVHSDRRCTDVGRQSVNRAGVWT